MDKSKEKSLAKVNVNAVVVGDEEVVSGRGGRGTNDIEREAEKFISETESETGRTAKEGFG
jgi:hypothetical protein